MTEKRETRAVTSLHAELALCEAIHRMSTAIYQANNHDPENRFEADVTKMVMELASQAASVAAELMSELHIGEPRPSGGDLSEDKCFTEWFGFIDGSGPVLRIRDAEEMDDAA